MRSFSRQAVQLPAAAQRSLEQLADDLRGRGFIVTGLTADRFEAHPPPSLYGDVIDIERWFPSARIIITKTTEGISISHRTPIRRFAVTSVALGILSVTSFPGTIATRLLIGAGAAVFMLVFQVWNGRRRAPTALSFGGAHDPTKTPQ